MIDVSPDGPEASGGILFCKKDTANRRKKLLKIQKTSENYLILQIYIANF